MFDQFLKRADELLAKGEPFAIAMVVRYQAPISGKPGNKAIVLGDGTIWGWIGGGCAQPVVVKEALKSLADGQPRLIRISPSASPEEGIIDYAMTCHSGGTLDIYIEPVLAKPHLLILGRSPVARTLAALGKTIGYAVSVAAPEADRESFPDVDRVQSDLDLSQVESGRRLSSWCPRKENATRKRWKRRLTQARPMWRSLPARRRQAKFSTTSKNAVWPPRRSIESAHRLGSTFTPHRPKRSQSASWRKLFK